MPTASVIIPCYNHANYLTDAIDSVMAQTRFDVETIVVDDGSTDQTRNVATQFGLAIQYIFQDNQGLSAARNAGLALAKGRYICVLDADDLLEPDYMSHMVEALESVPDVGAVYCSFRTVDHENRSLFQTGHSGVPPDQLHERLSKGNFMVPHCMLVRREIYDVVGPFDESLTACEDWDMWLRIARDQKVVPLDSLLARYRVLPGSMSGDPQRMLTNRLAVLDKERPFLSDVQYERGVAYAYGATAFEWLQSNNRVASLNCLGNAANHYVQILEELETWYELALWDQPKGYRGDLTRVNPTESEQRLVEYLEQLFADMELADSSSSYRRTAYSQAYRALGNISYAKRNMSLARRYFRLSLTHDPRQAVDLGLSLTAVKSLLPARWLPSAT